MKFDFIIGNPPYQDETVGDQKTFAPPIYHKFIDAVRQVSEKVLLIHPARFLFNAGNTPKQWNRQMLQDSHFKVLMYEQDSSKIFNNTEIKGGVVISYCDAKSNFGEIGTFTVYPELNAILKKVRTDSAFESFSTCVISRTAYRLTDVMHREHPEALEQLSDGHPYDMSTNIFDRLPQIFFDERPQDSNSYIRILGRTGNERVYKYVKEKYVNEVSNLHNYKVFLSSANSSGAFGEALTPPIIGEPDIGSTETFVSIGAFNTVDEANAVFKYIETKFARALLGILKVTQHITPEKWAYVPLQDFTAASDIDWSKSIPEIDQQLYAKYGLDESEIAFIESHVKEMN